MAKVEVYEEEKQVDVIRLKLEQDGEHVLLVACDENGRKFDRGVIARLEVFTTGLHMNRCFGVEVPGIAVGEDHKIREAM